MWRVITRTVTLTHLAKYYSGGDHVWVLGSWPPLSGSWGVQMYTDTHFLLLCCYTLAVIYRSVVLAAAAHARLWAGLHHGRRYQHSVLQRAVLPPPGSVRKGLREERKKDKDDWIWRRTRWPGVLDPQDSGQLKLFAAGVWFEFRAGVLNRLRATSSSSRTSTFFCETARCLDCAAPGLTTLSSQTPDFSGWRSSRTTSSTVLDS